jgi:hypothetical protein
MSYARWGDGSSVYVFADASGGVACCGCSLDESVYESDGVDFLGIEHKKGERMAFGATVHFFDVDSLIEHFQKHRDAGDFVPKYLFDPETYDKEDFEAHR